MQANGSKSAVIGDRRLSIVHVTADYPDAYQRDKTQVIKTLVELVDDRFDQRVMSLNRRSPDYRALLQRGDPFRIRVRNDTDSRLDPIRYYAPGRGILHRTMLERLGDWITRWLGAEGVPDLIVGHKLSVEGIAVARAARLLGIPYALSIQGDTDTKILSYRRDLRSVYAQIYHEAAVVFPFTPWAQRKVEDALGARTGPTILLPCPTVMDTIIPPVTGVGGAVSAFHLASHRRKNAARMFAAAKQVAQQQPGFRLGIVGGGAANDDHVLRRLARSARAVKLEGALSHTAIPGRLNQSAGFVLPSLRESFGLVFVEALFAGTPIVYPADTAVDGYFDDKPFAIRVDARSVESIAAGMTRLMREEKSLKEELAKWQASPDMEAFRRPAIARKFGDGLALAAARDTTP